MFLDQLIKPDQVACRVEARSKKHCLEVLSRLLSGHDRAVPAEEIFARLVERERLGCTSLTQGTAFPHCRVPGLEAARGALLTLAVPVEFDAVDGGTVDLVFGLVVPEVLDDSHYAAMDRITRLTASEELRSALRAAQDDRELYRVLMSLGADSERGAGSG